jgi:gliding motility-associated-like protein
MKPLKIICLLCILIFNKNVFATHIVGGDLGYEYISENNYRITMYLYIDCVNGNPGAISQDSSAIFTFFNAKNDTLIDIFELRKKATIRIEGTNYDCLEIEPNACVSRFTFSFVKEIDPGTDGIIIAFQRCCRNHTITNLVNPGNTGATFYTKIPAKNVVEENSSALFKKLPPNFLCTEAPLIFDHSAHDKDGDSLIYELNMPFVGAGPSRPRPNFASTPSHPNTHYPNVNYKSPYNLSNMMGGTELLSINRYTGELRVTPSIVGQFVVGMKVSEYRNGVKIAETYRDYQFNVLQCHFSVVANFNSPDTLCAKTVDFENRSTGVALNYNWDFGDKEITNDRSTNKNTSWTYNKHGRYKVSLVVFNDGCRDTISKYVEILPSDSIFARFTVTPISACDSITVNINNTTGPVKRFRWFMGDGVDQQYNKEITEYKYTKPGLYVIRLEIEDSNYCNIVSNASKEVHVFKSVKRSAKFLTHHLTDCASDGKVDFFNVSENNKFIWDYGDGTSTENELENPHKYSEAGTYTITYITTDTGKCVQNDTFRQTVTIENPTPILEGITLYNIFTPNNDAYNNCFKIDVEKINCVEVNYRIYNRWGELVHESFDPSGCWDGTHINTSIELPSGEYFGIYRFTLLHNKEVVEASNVISLVR